MVKQPQRSPPGATYHPPAQHHTDTNTNIATLSTPSRATLGAGTRHFAVLAENDMTAGRGGGHLGARGARPILLGAVVRLLGKTTGSTGKRAMGEHGANRKGTA